jgi:hypothetical protein
MYPQSGFFQYFTFGPTVHIGIRRLQSASGKTPVKSAKTILLFDEEKFVASAYEACNANTVGHGRWTVDGEWWTMNEIKPKEV